MPLPFAKNWIGKETAMKLVNFQDQGEARFGLLVKDEIFDVAKTAERLGGNKGLGRKIEYFFDDCEALTPALREVEAFIAAGSAAGLGVARDSVTLLPSIGRPPKIVCVARNYAEHAKEAGLEISPIPIVFARFSATLIGDRAPIVVPAVSPQLDWEGELAIVIGRHTRGRRISKAEAMDYVFGYTVFNDVTIRDFQFRVTQYTAGKNFRHSGPMGPSIVTKDEIADPHNLQITTRLNGKVEQSASTSTMIYDIPTILEHIAEFVDLEPGDVIPTGTPAGVGFKRKPPLFLKAGDLMEVEIDGLGKLSNPVIDEEARS